MNLFSVIATAVAGWFLFGRTRLNFHRGNTTKNRLPMTDHSNEPEYLQIFIKSVICPVCGSSFHIGFQAFYGDNETWLGGLFSLYPVDEKKKLIYFSNWIKKDRALLPKGSHCCRKGLIWIIALSAGIHILWKMRCLKRHTTYLSSYFSRSLQ